MKIRAVEATMAVVLSSGVYAQQAQPPAAAPAPPGAAQPASAPPLEIYRIDLVPGGTAYSLSKPALQGDVYVFTTWPEKQQARLPQAKVRKMTQLTKDLDHEVVYQIDLVPSGRMIARDNPTLKGTTYTFRTWRDNTLMSLRQADVQKVTKVTGLAAFKIQQELRGAKLTANLPMEGGSATIIPAPEPSGAPPPGAAGHSDAQGNWVYDGVPGVTDAYAPPNAVVASPGDVPKAAPVPTQPPH